MKVKELINILSQYPEDMEVWVSDRGYCEGGEKLTKVEKLIAYDAGLDGSTDITVNDFVLIGVLSGMNSRNLAADGSNFGGTIA